MSVRGQVMLDGGECQLVPVACLAPQPSFACLGHPPNTHTTWTTSAGLTYGNVQSTYMTGGYSSVRMASTSRVDVGVIQRKVSAPPPATAHCPTVPLPQLSRTSFHVGYYVPPAVEPGDPYG
ncbi:hypothetical protein Pcinc_039251 [Petrolisthes cinctipes]|uniref:Uncharacterized protein n=1 Tax=Petrolisthes cinctipes TaxID=88211 RepID=A0AAE1BRQ1_PETCI|nr:hypothetical protein Pcinc_039251 [Petrolisthes cinctipes]